MTISFSTSLFGTLLSFGLLITPSWSVAAPMLQDKQEDQADKNLDTEAKFDIIFEKANAELRRMCKNEANLQVDFLRRYYNLDEQSMRKAKVLVKGEAAKHAVTFEKRLKSNLRPLIGEIDGEKFSVNGTEFTFDDKPQKGAAFAEIHLVFRQNATWLNIMVRRANSGSGRGFRSADAVPFDISQSRNWRKSLTMLSDAQMEEVENRAEQNRKRDLINALLIVFSERLHLDKQQEITMKGWLLKRVDDVGNQPLLDEIKRQVNANQLIKATPKFLNKTQKQTWRQLKNSRYPLGW